MEGFSTPGVMLFAQRQGDPEDLTILEEMIATARKIANTLGGDVLDETRRPLTVRKEEDLRAAVLANEARFARLARS
jgi:cell division protein ZipA